MYEIPSEINLCIYLNVLSEKPEWVAIRTWSSAQIHWQGKTRNKNIVVFAFTILNTFASFEEGKQQT